MSGKQAKRHRALERRMETLESWLNVGIDRNQEAHMEAARAARRREREGRRREYIWRSVALAVVLAALIVAVLAAGV